MAARGASLKDPKLLFNAGLDAKSTRAIDFTEGDTIDEAALKVLIRAAVAYNLARDEGSGPSASVRGESVSRDCD